MIGDDERFTKPVHLERERLIARLAGLDLCVIPSLWPETGPLALADAFESGLPVIAPDSGAFRERVKDGVDGLLFKYGSAESLSERIMRILMDRDLLQQLKRNVPQVDFENHIADKMQELYDLIK
jgi:glycosyltransferase involved in cell wall biosynthesis